MVDFDMVENNSAVFIIFIRMIFYGFYIPIDILAIFYVIEHRGVIRINVETNREKPYAKAYSSIRYQFILGIFSGVYKEQDRER